LLVPSLNTPPAQTPLQAKHEKRAELFDPEAPSESSLRRPIPTESAPRKPRRRPGGKRSPSGRTWPKEENEGSSGRKEPGAGVVAPPTPQPDESEHPHTNEREGRRLGHDVEAAPSRELGER